MTALDVRPAAPTTLVPAAAPPSLRPGDPVVQPTQWRLRAAGVLVAVTACWYLPWMSASTNRHAVWLSWPFVAANLVLVGAVLLSWVNSWQRSIPADLLVEPGAEPLVAVIVPSAGEPVAMVEATLRSVLDQDWPQERMTLLVGDDAANPAMAAMVARLAAAHPRAIVHLYLPPARGSALRQGDAKAGNLNAGLAELDRLGLEAGVQAGLVETRDADDLVGDPTFLRRCAAQIVHDPAVAYVQTVKEAEVASGDPFGNLESMFYRGSLAARNAANSVFPCGSGLLWRRAALDSIGGFPSWNLVEDLQSGVEALRRGWRGVALPLVGALGQTAPEDIPNVYKQRGTWAIDTVRLLVWGDLRGLSLRQRLQFLELGLFYAQSLSLLLFAVVPAVGLLTHTYPLISSPGEYAAHFWPFTIATELFLLSMNTGGRFEVLFRARQMWVGMAPVYARACISALLAGPHRKPTYRVTRKTHAYAWYWRQTLPHAVLIGLLVVAIVKAALTESTLDSLDVGSAYWGLVSLLLLGSWLPRSWHGLRWRWRGPTRRAVAP